VFSTENLFLSVFYPWLIESMDAEPSDMEEGPAVAYSVITVQLQ
jgi:hypothetical protein